MTIGSNQPYLFPYIGYWQLINLSDIYVISDSMQYIKKGYINRNNILIDGTKHMFTLEAIGVKENTLINEVKVGNNRKKLAKSIFHAYKKAPYFEEVYPLIEKIILNPESNMAQFVGNSIQEISKYLDMDTKFIYLSDLQGKTTLRAQARTIDICERLDARHYINAVGGKELYCKDAFIEKDMKLNFLKTNELEYKQFDNEFVSHLSILDVLMFNSKNQIQEMLQAYILE